MRTFRHAKAMASTLRAELRDRHRLELKHAEALEVVAHQFGKRDWNRLAAEIERDVQPPRTSPGGINLTIPVLRVFSEPLARQFYVDFLGFHLDFGGPAEGPGTPFYGQVSRNGTTLHLAEYAYEPTPGATVLIWMSGLNELHAALDANEVRTKLWGPAVWMPVIEELPWGVRSLAIGDPFGNTIRFYEPIDRDLHPYLPAQLPMWAGS